MNHFNFKPSIRNTLIFIYIISDLLEIQADAGSDMQFCDDGPCARWAGTMEFNISIATPYFVYWGPSTGWAFALLATIMIPPWIGYAFWSTKDHEIMGVVEAH